MIPLERTGEIPAHVEVRERLLEAIRVGELTLGEQIPPEPELAKAFGTSRMTANKGILSLVQDGYLVRHRGRGTFVLRIPSRRLTKCLVIVSEGFPAVLDDHYFGSLIGHIISFFDQAEVPVEIVSALRPDVLSVQPEGVGVLAIAPQRPTYHQLCAMAEKGTPTVVLGVSWQDRSVSTVDSDNLLGAQLATRHLLDQGRTRLVMVGAVPEHSNTLDRVRGFETATKLLGSEPGKVLMLPEAVELSERVEEELFAEIDQGTNGVFAAGAEIALQVIAAAQRRGLKVPHDLAVVAYDDPAFLSYIHPAVTTVRQPLADMALASCQLLVELSSAPVSPSRHLVLDPRLEVRQSSAFFSPDGNIS